METNNKLREALMQVDKLNDLWFDTFTLPDGATSIHDEIEDVISAALAEPVKNCEVGTAEEQAERFAEYCDSEVCKRNRCRFNAKALCIERCALAWAQMPYAEQEGGNK